MLLLKSLRSIKPTYFTLEVVETVPLLGYVFSGCRAATSPGLVFRAEAGEVVRKVLLPCASNSDGETSPWASLELTTLFGGGQFQTVGG